ncbi:MAG: DUF4126 domain-containing protein [Lachnospiraceae bacterium]|nr:DUF4126 domain-containing protein [Lachnospiraceae bacterium]
MTYSQIFEEIYYKNKKFILTCITICLVFSILAFGNGNQSLASSTFNTTEIVTTLGGSGGQMLAPLTLAQGCLNGIDASSAMLFLCVVSLSLDFIPKDALVSFGDTMGIEGLGALSDYSFGLIEYHVFKVLCLLWFIITKLAKSNHVSREVAVILEDWEGKIGVFVNILVISSQFLANVPLGATVQAASSVSQPENIVRYGFNALICFVLLIVTLAIYFFTRYLFYFIDIVLLPICSFIPFSSFGIEVVKTLGTAILLYIAIFHPIVFYVLLALILIVAIALFRVIYTTIRYFKNIYVKPFFKRFAGYDNTISLVTPKIPKKMKQVINEADANIILPVYIIKKLPEQKAMRSHDRWWFVSAKDKQFLCKPCFMKNGCHIIELNNSMDKKMFIKKSLRFFEMFNLKGSEENIGYTFRKVPKKLHFVFSKEYYYRFDEIKELTQYTDYTELKNQRKQDLKLSREEKRQAKREAREEQRIARQQNKVLT